MESELDYSSQNSPTIPFLISQDDNAAADDKTKKIDQDLHEYLSNFLEKDNLPIDDYFIQEKASQDRKLSSQDSYFSQYSFSYPSSQKELLDVAIHSLSQKSTTSMILDSFLNSSQKKISSSSSYLEKINQKYEKKTKDKSSSKKTVQYLDEKTDCYIRITPEEYEKISRKREEEIKKSRILAKKIIREYTDEKGHKNQKRKILPMLPPILPQNNLSNNYSLSNKLSSSSSNIIINSSSSSNNSFSSSNNSKLSAAIVPKSTTRIFKNKGRRKVDETKYILNRTARNASFSKRKDGSIKKLRELSAMTGAQVMIIIKSEHGNVFSYKSRNLENNLSNSYNNILIHEKNQKNSNMIKKNVL